jgi:hypothetical protein
MRIFRHLGLERVADEEACGAAEHDHRDHSPIGAHLGETGARRQDRSRRRGDAPWGVECPV